MAAMAGAGAAAKVVSEAVQPVVEAVQPVAEAAANQLPHSD